MGTGAIHGTIAAASDHKAKPAPAKPPSSVVHLTNALVRCDDHVGELEHENLNLRARNGELEERFNADAMPDDDADASSAQALQQCREALSDARHQNQRLMDSNTKLLSLVRERGSKKELAQHAAVRDVVTDLARRAILPKPLRRAVAHARLLEQCVHVVEVVRQAIAQAAIEQYSVAVVILDLEGAHAVADPQLQALARRVCTHVGGSDLCHYGGVRFVLLLPNLRDDALAKIAGTVSQHVAEQCTVDGLDLSVTVSIGVAQYPRDGIDVDGLLHTADKAMGLHKPKGDSALPIRKPPHCEAVPSVT